MQVGIKYISIVHKNRDKKDNCGVVFIYQYTGYVRVASLEQLSLAEFSSE